MELTGKLTADAEVKKANNKEFVTFCVVVNDYYKTKDGEKKELSEFFNCTYWLSTKVADRLQKGCVVTVSGRVYLNEYKDKDGKQHASLGFAASGIKIVAFPNRNTAQKKETAVAAGTPETKDDLPF